MAHNSVAAQPECGGPAGLSMRGRKGLRRQVVRTHLAPLLAAMVVLAAAANVHLADTVTKTDGTVLTGRIIEENDLWVVLEVDRGTAKLTLPIARRAIRSITRGPEQAGPATGPTTASAPAGPGYYPLPLKGEIGIEVKAEFLTAALTDARSRKPDFVVLAFDTAGGSLEETDKLMKVVADARDLRILAYVRKATSSAALVALTCPEIYMATDGMIGAPLPGGPRAQQPLGAVDRKTLWSMRARSRRAARSGRHSILIGQGMFDPDLELVLATEAGKPVVKQGKGGKVLKAKGKLLTLIGAEAVECGLAKGSTRDVAALDKVMGLKEWHKVPGGGWARMIQKGRDNRRNLETAERKRRRDAYMAKIAPELERIDKELADVKAEGKDAEADKRKLQREYDRAVANVQANYRRQTKDADRYADSNPELRRNLRRRAKERRDDDLRDLKRRFKPRADKIQAEIRRLLEERKRLRAERQKLLADAPK